jgi:CRISPR-associated protein Csb1
MPNSEILEKYDELLKDKGPCALVVREYLMPVEGHDGVLFPATFAPSQDNIFKGGYNIDEFPDGSNVCLVDSVGSQVNRIEPLFEQNEYKSLVPQLVVNAGKKKVNLLEAGHRAGDAIVRCSGLRQELQNAFKQVQDGNAEPLAKIAPTSLVFGVWDSRDTQAKLPRLISSTIRAFDVHRLTRSAVYIPAAEYVKEGLLEDPKDKKTKDAYAERGFVHQPASSSHGGVIATDGIRRDASLHLAALRLLSAGENKEKTLFLRRYILGLALIAFTAQPIGYLRQGCNLVLDPDKSPEIKKVFCDGRRENFTLSHEDALLYAKAAAEVFGIGSDREVMFIEELAKQEVSESAGEGKQKTKRSRGQEIVS